MKQKRNLIITCAIFIILLVGAGIGYQILTKQNKPSSDVVSEQDADSDSDEGSKNADEPLVAPNLTLYREDGSSISLSDLFGKPIVFNFWNSNCPPCRQEMPVFDRISRERADVQFVMLDCIGVMGETFESGNAFLAEANYSFPVYFDLDETASYTYGLYAFPTTLFLNAEGEVITGVQGAINEETLLKGIDMITTTQQ